VSVLSAISSTNCDSETLAAAAAAAIGRGRRSLPAEAGRHGSAPSGRCAGPTGRLAFDSVGRAGSQPRASESSDDDDCLSGAPSKYKV
jgi:hypothetical protein